MRHVRRTCSLALVVLGLGVLSSPASAETSSHERVGVRAKTALEFSLGLDAGLWSLGAEGLGMSLGLSLEASVASALTASVSLPLELRVISGPPPQYYRSWGDLAWLPGDLALGLDARTPLGPWLLDSGLSASLPLLSTDLARRAGRGSKVELSLGGLRFMDPLILGLSLKGGLSFVPGRAWTDPGFSLGSSLWATEAFNERVSGTLGLSTNLGWPGGRGPEARTVALDFALSARVLVLGEKGGFAFGVSQPSAPRASLSVYRRIRFLSIDNIDK